MPIKLFTGLPGSGKSLSAVEILVAEAKKADRRPIYSCGIDGLVEGLAQPLTDPLTWESLPDGSLIVVDEAQKYFPTRRMTDPTPPIRALSEHRHRGFDFVLVTQHPTMLDSYVRKLVSEHVHVIRRFGTKFADRYTWGECVDDLQSENMRSKAQRSIWTYPAKLFSTYRSATLHTVKSRMPKRVWVGLAALVLAVVLIGYTYRHLRPSVVAHASPATSQAQGGAAAAPASGGNGSVLNGAPINRFHTPEEYVAYFQPRVPGLPWSSQAFDSRKVAAEPDLYCIDVEGEACRCYTEQMTRYTMDAKLCGLMARNGVYNPFKRPIRDTATASTEATRAKDQHQAQDDEGEGRRTMPALSQAPQRHSGQESDLHRSYDPDLMGAHNAR
jgi:zona occludens toxin